MLVALSLIAALASEDALSGRLVPADGRAVEITLDTYTGSLPVASVVGHGQRVEEGQTLVTFDWSAFEDALEKSARTVEKAERSHRHLQERQAMQRETAVRALDANRRALEDAKRALDAWREHERAFEHESAALSRQAMAASISDQEDELAQLEAMYREDELTDATEELVLQRARRALASSVRRLELSDERRAHYLRVTEPQTQARLERTVEDQEVALAHRLRNQAMEKADAEAAFADSARSLAEARSHHDGLERDRQLLDVRAPRAGVLVHGAADDYGVGGTPPQHAVGDALKAGTCWFTVMTPDRWSVSLEVPEARLSKFANGTAVTVHLVLGDQTVEAPLRVERFPTPASVRGAANLYRATVALAGTLPGLVPGARASIRVPGEAP